MKTFAKVAFAVAALAGSAAAQAEVITFEDAATSQFAYLPSSYHGLTWTNWATTGPAYTTSGYRNDVVSGTTSACGCASDFKQTVTSISAVSGTFDLGSGYFASAWNDGATLTMRGLLGGVETNIGSYLLNTTGPQFLSFNFLGIDKAEFSITGGVHNDALNGAGDYFALDNLQIGAAVPEPASWALMIGGFGFAGVALRRRTKTVKLAAA